MMKKLSRRNFVKLSGTSFALSSMGLPLLPDFHKGDEPVKILLYTGWNTKNIGDQGHTPGTLRFLESYYPESQITVWLYSTNEEINKMLKQRFPNISIVTGTLDLNGMSEDSDLQKAFFECNLVIHNSGMHYNSFWETPSILKTCNQNNKPICLYSQSFDGFKESIREEMVKQLSKAMAIYCRDVESYYYLRKIGVKTPILEFGPDGCFGIDLKNDKKADLYLKENGLEPKKFIVVIIRSDVGRKPITWPANNNETNTIDSENLNAIQVDSWMSKVRKLVIHCVQETGMKVLLAPEVKKEIIQAKQLIYDKLPVEIQKNVIHKAEWWNMDEADSVYMQAHSMVAMEPHSCIMALAHGVPTIHFYSQRHGVKAWMFRDIGLPEWLYDIDEEPAENVMKSLMDIVNDYNRAQRKVKRAMAFIEQRSEEMMTDIKTFLA